MKSHGSSLAYSGILATVICLILPSFCHAVPYFAWDQPWDEQIIILQDDGQANAEFYIYSETYGSSGSSNVGIEGSASSQSIGFWDSGTNYGTALVYFWRSFTLSGNSSGWDVTISGMLSNYLRVRPEAIISESTYASAFIDYKVMSGNTQKIGFQDLYTLYADSGADTTKSRIISTSANGTLQDGTYTLMGVVKLDAESIADWIYAGRANSDLFYSLGFTSIPIAAPQPVPVPEPSTLMLFGLGFIGLGYYGWKRII